VSKLIASQHIRALAEGKHSETKYPNHSGLTAALHMKHDFLFPLEQQNIPNYEPKNIHRYQPNGN